MAAPIDISFVPMHPIIMPPDAIPGGRVVVALVETSYVVTGVCGLSFMAFKALKAPNPERAAIALGTVAGLLVTTLQFSLMPQATQKPTATEVRDQYY